MEQDERVVPLWQTRNSNKEQEGFYYGDSSVESNNYFTSTQANASIDYRSAYYQ